MSFGGILHFIRYQTSFTSSHTQRPHVT